MGNRLWLVDEAHWKSLVWDNIKAASVLDNIDNILNWTLENLKKQQLKILVQWRRPLVAIFEQLSVIKSRDLEQKPNTSKRDENQPTRDEIEPNLGKRRR